MFDKFDSSKRFNHRGPRKDLGTTKDGLSYPNSYFWVLLKIPTQLKRWFLSLKIEHEYSIIYDTMHGCMHLADQRTKRVCTSQSRTAKRNRGKQVQRKLS